MFTDFLIKLIGCVCNTSSGLPRSPSGTAFVAFTGNEPVSKPCSRCCQTAFAKTRGWTWCSKVPSSMLTDVGMLSHSCISTAVSRHAHKDLQVLHLPPVLQYWNCLMVFAIPIFPPCSPSRAETFISTWKYFIFLFLFFMSWESWSEQYF